MPILESLLHDPAESLQRLHPALAARIAAFTLPVHIVIMDDSSNATPDFFIIDLKSELAHRFQLAM